MATRVSHPDNRIQAFHRPCPPKCCSFWGTLKKVLIVISILALGYQVLLAQAATNKPSRQEEMDRLNEQNAKLSEQRKVWYEQHTHTAEKMQKNPNDARSYEEGIKQVVQLATLIPRSSGGIVVVDTPVAIFDNVTFEGNG